ncbi:hypothetical protein [Desulfocurvus vexinensis]|uniref:hypothetical protein n=1 Tax=Desulfocurvus vexinensis TaxID=399548 RepID=UPI00048D04B2|nr:hypothetical protein [Desulfocurvus vexinensis]
MLRETVRKLLERNCSAVTPLFRLRRELCGALFNRAQLRELGWKFSYGKNGSVWYEKGFQEGAQDWTVRLFLHREGFLRDIQVFTVHPEAAINAIWREESDLLPCEEQVREEFLCGIQRHAPASAEHEIFAISEGWTADGSEGLSERGKRSRVVVGRTEALAEDDPGTARRYVVGVSRWSPCLEPVTLEASLAHQGALLGLRQEASILLLSALDSDADTADLWNLAGCVLDSLAEKALAFECFKLATQRDLDHPSAPGNTWLLGMPFLERRLKSRDFRAALDVADDLLSCPAPESDTDKQKALEASALCCEGLGLPDEARDRFTSLLGEYPDGLVAQLGLNRLTERDGALRKTAFEQQLAAFPRIPQEVEGPDSLAVDFIAGCDHGDHWASLVPDVGGFIDSYLETIVQAMKVTAEADFPAAMRVRGNCDKAFAGFYPEDASLFCLALCTHAPEERRLDFASMYPCATWGASIDLEPLSFEEWERGVEGSVVLATPEGLPLTAFVPLYLRNRRELRPEHKYPFIISGFAMSVYPAEDHDFEISQGPLTFDEDGNDMGPQTITMGTDRSTLFPSFEYPSEYHYILPVLSVDWVDFMGNRVCRITTRHDTEGGAIPMTLYAGEHLLGDYLPRKGDAIEGALCLQAYLASGQGVPVDRQEKEGKRLQPGRITFSRPGQDLFGLMRDPGEHALNAASGIKRYSAIPLRLDNQPQFVAERTNGERCFVYVSEFLLDDRDWDAAHRAAQARLETRITHREYPLHIVGVGKRPVGNGYSFSYYGWDVLDDMP